MNFKQLIQEKRIIFFDGAMGTFLQPYLSPGLPPEKLNLMHPQKVKNVHLSYLNQGVDIIETNTFGANRIKLEKFNLAHRLRDINYRAVRIAKEAVSHQLVGASIGPLGGLIQPWGEITTHQALEVFKEQIEIVAEAGADIIVIETMMSLKEAKIAVVAAREICGLPIVCQLTFGEQGRTLTGTDPQTAVFTLESMDTEVLGANCSIGPKKMFPVVKTMVSTTSKPLIFQPNAGEPFLTQGKTAFPVGPEEFSRWIKKFVENGVRIVGGCCGTTPEHIGAVIKNIKKISSPAKKNPVLKGFSSRTKVYFLKKDDPVCVGINFSSELVEKKKPDEILELVAKAEEKELSFLNLSFRKMNKDFKITPFVNLLQQSTNLGIGVDIDEPSSVDEALGELEGRGLVFLSLHEEEIFKIAKKWGATPGFNIYLNEKSCVEKEIKTILQKCKKTGTNMEKVVVKITLPPFCQHNRSFRDRIIEINQAKQHTPITTILELSDYSREAPGAWFLKGFLLGAASWYGVEGALLEPGEIEPSLLILKAAEALSMKDAGGRKFINFIGAKNANF